jgi:hypothetical protein
MNPDRYLYIHDASAGRAIVIDRETGKEVESRTTEFDALLQAVRDRLGDGALRDFALWCARHGEAVLIESNKEMLEAAEHVARDRLKVDALIRIRHSNRSTQAAATSVGLPRGIANAAAYLAAYAAIDPGAFNAALEAARMHRLYERLANDADDSPAGEIMQRQIDRLLEMLSGAAGSTD